MMSAVMIISMSISLPVSATSDDFGNAMEFAKSIKLFDETAEGTDNLTRAQMAAIICSMFDMMSDTAGEWYNNAFKDSNSDVVLENLNAGSEFEDVQETDEFYSYIKTVVDRGFMVGVSETKFMPDAPMTYMQFLKVILCVMGYKDMAELRGGYPSGYLSIAGNIGFRKINGKDYNSHITLEEVAYIIRENLDTPIATFEYEGGGGWKIRYDDKLFGEEILGIYKYTNRVNAIGKLNLYDDGEYGENTVLVGETLFDISEGYEIDEKFFGRDVTVYYTEDDGDKGPVIYAEQTGKDDAVTFSIDKLEDFKSDSITYLDGARLRTVKTKNGAYFISNGEQVLTYGKENFDFDYGEVTLIRSKGESAYNIIVVSGYNSVYVSGIDSTNQIIYTSSGKRIEFPEDEDNYKITKNGEEKGFSDISIDSIIDVSESTNRIKINIPDSQKSIMVKSTGSGDGGKYIITGESEKLNFADSFLESTSYIAPKVGVEYTVLLNCNGDIAWIKAGAASGNVGYFLKAIYDRENESAMLKLLKEDGETEVITCSKKLTICDENDVEHKNITEDKVSGYFENDDGSSFSGLLRYTLDTDGKIKKIELPITNPKIKVEGKFYDLKAMHGYGDISGHFTGWTWSGMFFVSSAYTKAIFIPSTEGDDSKHTVVACGNVPTGGMKAKFYGTNPTGVEAEYMVTTQSVVQGYKRPTDFKHWAVVKERSVCYDEVSDEVVDKLTVVTIQTNDFSTIKEIELTAPYEYINQTGDECSIIDMVNDVGQSKDESGNIRNYSLGVGDIIYYTVDTFNELTGVSLLYKADMKNPYADKQEKQGWLAGTYDDYRTGKNNEKYSNPYSLSGSELLATGLSYICDVIRIHKVSPYARNDYSYMSTSLDLNTYAMEDAELKIEGDNKSHYLNGKRYPVFAYPYPARGTTITILKNGKVEVKAFSKHDMKPADIYGKDCSTVIQFLSWSSSVGLIVINDER